MIFHSIIMECGRFVISLERRSQCIAKQTQLHIPTRALSQDSDQSGLTFSLIIFLIERMEQNAKHKLRIYCIIK